jgi:hypothetical protein
MDGDKFHRADIVPIYLKGYKPTPATGLQRSNVLKRLTTLSKKRGVTIGVSGGHGVIVADQTSAHSENKRVATLLTLQSSLSKAAQPQAVFSMPTSSWDQPLSRVSGNDKSLAYRLGTNLANGSSFESFDLFSSNERGWNIDQNNFSLSTEKAVSGDKSMKSVLTSQGNDTFAMTNFRRVYKGGNPMTVQFNVNATLATKVRVYWQGRKNRDKFSDALANGEKHLIGDYALSGSGDWQLINTQFNTPRVGYRSVRILLEFENTASSSNPVYVDDVAFIQWNSAFNAIDANPLSNELTSQSSFIEFNRPLTSKDAVTLSFK